MRNGGIGIKREYRDGVMTAQRSVTQGRRNGKTKACQDRDRAMERDILGFKHN